MTETSRYERQELVSFIGKKGQEKLRNKHVLLIGVGALGAANAESLVRAGIGELTLVDRDYVELHNLHRQQLFTEQDAINVIPKAVAAKKHLQKINSDCKIHRYILDVTTDNISYLAKNVDLILDGTDNFDIRMLINDISQELQIPWIYGACIGTVGVVFPIIPKRSPCLHCILKKIPATYGTCDTIGVLPATVQMVTSIQLAEALKILVEDWDSVQKGVFLFDSWSNDYIALNVEGAKEESCPSCGNKRTYPYKNTQNVLTASMLCGNDTIQLKRKESMDYELKELAKRLSKQGKVKANNYLLHFEHEQFRLVIFHDGRTLVHGASNEEEAKQIYYQFLG